MGIVAFDVLVISFNYSSLHLSSQAYLSRPSIDLTAGFEWAITALHPTKQEGSEMHTSFSLSGVDISVGGFAFVLCLGDFYLRIPRLLEMGWNHTGLYVERP